MGKVIEFLQGKKTYLVALSAVIAALVALADGQVSGAQAGQMIVTAVLGCTIRAGVQKAHDDINK